MAENTTFNTTFTNSTNSTNSSWQSTTPRTWTDFWLGLLWPILYITILVGSLSTFSSLYRKRKTAKAARLESWFPPHRQRDIYLSLLHLEPPEEEKQGEEKKKTLSRVPDNVLKAALLKRAVEDIQRIVQLRSSKAALQTLMQRGSIGEDLWQRFLRAEREMEEEVKDVVNEANAFAPQWGQVIFQSANEINQNRLMKERIAELQATTEAEKAWWDEKRSKTSASFLKELDEAAAQKVGAGAAKGKHGSSDEDTVLVESGGPGSTQGSMKGQKKGGKK